MEKIRGLLGKGLLGTLTAGFHPREVMLSPYLLGLDGTDTFYVTSLNAEGSYTSNDGYTVSVTVGLDVTDRF